MNATLPTAPSGCVANADSTGFFCPDYCGPGRNWTVNFSPNSFTGGYVFECTIDGCQKGLSPIYDCGQEVYHELDKTCLPCVPSNLQIEFSVPTPEVNNSYLIDLIPIGNVTVGNVPTVSFYSSCPSSAGAILTDFCTGEFEGCVETTYCVETASWANNCSNFFQGVCSAMDCSGECASNFQLGVSYPARTPVETLGFQCNGYDPSYVAPTTVGQQAGDEGFSCTHKEFAFPLSIYSMSSFGSSSVVPYNFTAEFSVSCNRFDSLDTASSLSAPQMAGSVCTCQIAGCNSCAFDPTTSLVDFDCSNIWQGPCVGYQNGVCRSNGALTTPAASPTSSPLLTSPTKAPVPNNVTKTSPPTFFTGATVGTRSPTTTPIRTTSPTHPTVNVSSSSPTASHVPSVPTTLAPAPPSVSPSVNASGSPSLAPTTPRARVLITFPVQITNYLFSRVQDSMQQALNQLAAKVAKDLFGRRRLRRLATLLPLVDLQSTSFGCPELNNSTAYTIVCYNVSAYFPIELSSEENADQISSQFAPAMSAAIKSGELINDLKQIDSEAPVAMYVDQESSSVSEGGNGLELWQIGVIAGCGTVFLIIVFSVVFWFYCADPKHKADAETVAASRVGDTVDVKDKTVRSEEISEMEGDDDLTPVPTQANAGQVAATAAPLVAAPVALRSMGSSASLSSTDHAERTVLLWLAQQGNVEAALATLDRMVPKKDPDENNSKESSSGPDPERMRQQAIIEFLVMQTMPNLADHIEDFMTRFAGREAGLIAVLQGMFQQGTVASAKTLV